MKILIMSDSHGLTSEIVDIKNRHQEEVDLMLHCGDSELSNESDELSGFIGVKGNCDFGSRLPNEIIEDLQGTTLYMTHGHLYNVKMSLMSLKYRAIETNAKIACYGHSHIAGAELIDGVLLINPGSIRLPVLRRQKTYAILELEQNRANVTFFEVNGQIINELSKEFILK
ncbi:YfcE family phosphodiesterase [Bacillus sp. UMB0899]|uniref:metallophosphoesterase family protein n=1 Tax=Metabacillus schmidteae TaxID=2730405 RepID=UPI000C80F09C|nr:metallophosphoesterase [Metabacillus schmidteae]PMC37116.1 YfcE family phosphodiesterase [Bacillus sp. UMB0899]